MLENHMVIGDYYDDEPALTDDNTVTCAVCYERFYEGEIGENIHRQFGKWFGEWRCNDCLEEDNDEVDG